MKKRSFFTVLLLVFAAEAAALLVIFAAQDTEWVQDAVAVNEAVQSVQADWDAMERHTNRTGLEYVVIDTDGTVLFRTSLGLSESINRAISHRDTILDLEAGGTVVGKIILYNNSERTLGTGKRAVALAFAAALFIQCVVCTGYFLYLEHTVIRPFHKLRRFAGRVAEGNLDIPLTMDRQNLFGAFTESFDIMRSELKKARIAEAEANAGKKELVAKLSHDIKTPVASIKAASEVGAALADSERSRENYRQIVCKADQINTLITNLFTATLEELRQLPVVPADIESREVEELLRNADYLHRAVIPEVPGCLLYADRLRLQQVFDNIFANSYKYADTKIETEVQRAGNYLAISIEDYGGGVSKEELPLLKEKYKRGSHTGQIEGAGLGLYISDYFMKEMKGELVVENGQDGLRVMVRLAISGTI